MARYEAASVDDVPTGEMISVSLGSAQVLIANVDGKFYALDDLCPHLAVPLSQGSIANGCVVCPGHGSQFALADGKTVKWIGKKPGLLSNLLSGKAQDARTFAISVENGKLYVEI